MTRPPKRHIRRAFERAAATYDEAADVQRQSCAILAAGLPENIAPATILDAGCGTGHALGLLGRRYPAARLLACDIAPAMLARIGTDALRLAGDAERLPLAAGSVDLYWSSLAWQWCNLGSALEEARRVLRPEGTLTVATLGPATFSELRSAFNAVDDYRHTLAFNGPDAIEAEARRAGFRQLDIQRQTLLSHHADLKSLLRAIKAIGANQIGKGRRVGMMGRDTWRRAEAAYESLRQPAGLPLSYDLITLYAQP